MTTARFPEWDAGGKTLTTILKGYVKAQEEERVIPLRELYGLVKIIHGGNRAKLDSALHSTRTLMAQFVKPDEGNFDLDIVRVGNPRSGRYAHRKSGGQARMEEMLREHEELEQAEKEIRALDPAFRLSSPRIIRDSYLERLYLGRCLDAQKYICAGCGRDDRRRAAYHADLIVPFSKRGYPEAGNIQALCYACHYHKAQGSHEGLLEWIEVHDFWWDREAAKRAHRAALDMRELPRDRTAEEDNAPGHETGYGDSEIHGELGIG